MLINRVILTANFTADLVSQPLSFLLGQLGEEPDVVFAPYNQVFQQLLDPGSVLRTNQTGVNVVFVRIEDWAKADLSQGLAVSEVEALQRTVSELIEALKTIAVTARVPYLIVIGPPSMAASSNPHSAALLADMEARIARELQTIKGTHVITAETIISMYGVTEYDDPQGSRLGHVPYTESFFAAAAATIARRIYRLRFAPHKVIALDCDQTLWRGVCGEDGALGIEIDTARNALQQFMVEQQKAGMLLCLCSKNNEPDVDEVFNCRTEMPLKREHITARRINWLPKSENLRALAAELNLGLDSFIFVDDDPAVCAEIRANCSEVLTLQLPQQADDISQFLKHVWAFDHLPLTAEDRDRANLYKLNAEREELRSQSHTLNDFLASLDLKIEIGPMRTEHLARVASLTQRTNQFNFTTIRRSENEIAQLIEAGSQCVVADVSDRFGDYGLVGAVIFNTPNEALEVDSFLLSCRALGRGVEHAIVAHLGAVAEQKGLAFVDLHYSRTPKNRPAYEFLEALNASVTEAESEQRVYRISTATAVGLKLTFNTATNDAAGVSRPSSVETPPAGFGKATAFLTRVPHEFSSHEQICRALTTARQTERALQGVLVPPADEIEEQLRTLWEKILNVSQIGVEDNYFELGGDSFAAVALFAEVERVFGREFQLTTLLNAPTIRQLAELLKRETRQAEWSPLVPIQPQGSRPPFYCMHAAGGNVLFYRDLAKHLGVEQPLYGLQARGVDRNQTTHDTVEEMAAYYLEEIQKFQPVGPYHVGGSSFGGLVAFEMARQLERQGESVGLLALFDTYGPGYPQWRSNRSSIKALTEFLHRTQQVAETLKLLPLKEKGTYLFTKAGKVRKQWARKSAWRKNEFEIAYAAATGGALPKDMQRNHKAIDRALKSYQPGTYGGRLTLFRAAHQPLGIVPDEALGWKGLALGGLEIYEVPGFHGAVTVDPHAKFLAEKLSTCLLKAQFEKVDKSKRHEQHLNVTSATRSGLIVKLQHNAV